MSISFFKEDVAYWILVNSGDRQPKPNLRRTLALMFSNMPLRAVFWYRIAQSAVSNRVPFLAGLIRRMLISRHGLCLPPDLNINAGLYIPHTVGVTINCESIGKRCTIVGGVTIGRRGDGASPVIGDDVYIGAGARIIGAITIGNGAKIGANAVVTKDVPPGATAIGIPARVVVAASS